MSFLNFAKMCIRRHLITLLNASKNRKKDQSINRAISLDSSPVANGDEEDGRNTYANIIKDNKMGVDEELETNEAYEVTKNTLMNALSDFEKIVLNEYLSSSSYREISTNLSDKTSKRHNTKSIDNALLRIRKKAMQLKKYGKFEDLPIFMPKQ
jgi:DNA-directed RNA polymerase specialized sigma24 family protein